jgi:hypothetical protein
MHGLTLAETNRQPFESSNDKVTVFEMFVLVAGESGDLPFHSELYRLVADAVVTLEGQGVVVLVEEDLDRDSTRIGLAPGGIRAAMSAERALADPQVSRVADNRELDWCHVLLLAPNTSCDVWAAFH